MRIDIVTLFPAMCEGYIEESIVGRARRQGLVGIRCHNIRDYSDSGHRQADDYPYGGGQGMLLMAEPVARCFDAVIKSIESDGGRRPEFIFMSPKGTPFTQPLARELGEKLIAGGNICLLCGHYEGVDQRLLDEYIDQEISVGDFVLTGGELPALAVTDAVARLLPGVLAGDVSFEDESHWQGLLEHPQYTRPAVWRGREVPAALLSGHQKNIEEWKRERSLEETRRLRPDLWSLHKTPAGQFSNL